MVALGQYEKRLLWHPRRDNRFVVGGGSQITLYEWAAEHHEIRHLTSQHDLQFMKCFAWSPDPVYDDLIAVGLSTGKVDLLRLESNKFSGRNNVLSTGPAVSLPVRNSRSCHALAFCSVEPNYLAVGLDKVRGESSLIIWDIQSASTSLSIPSSNPDSVINGNLTRTPRAQHQIPRIDTGPRSDHRILQQHAPAETVSSVAFLPQTSSLLVAGISQRWLRLFDLRTTSSSTNVASKVQSIATDPFEANRIASFGDGLVSIWDIRRLTHPLLTFTERDARADGERARPAVNSVFSTIEFSSVRRGMLATLEKDANYVRFWDITQTQSTFLEGSSDGESIHDLSRARAPKMSWANLPWTAGSSGVQSQISSKDSEAHSAEYSLVLSDTRRTKNFSRTLASMALVPSAQPYPFTSNVMVVNKDGDLELYAIHDAPKHIVWSARGDLAVATSQSLKVLPGFNPTDPLTEPWNAFSDKGPQSSSSRRFRHKFRNGSTPGRGDDDGPPLTPNALPSQLPANLAATRPGVPQIHSSASLRKYNMNEDVEHKDLQTAGNNNLQPNTQSTGARHHTGNRNKFHGGGKDRFNRGFDSVLENDISMKMRHRVIGGYGLGNFQQNVASVRNASDRIDEAIRSLSELWTWLSQSKDVLCLENPKVHGYDFSCKGLIGIWEGFPPLDNAQYEVADPPPSEGFLDVNAALSRSERQQSRRSRSPSDHAQSEFQAALAALTLRKDPEMSTWKPTVPTSKLDARRLSLLLCEWRLKEEDLTNKIKRWEKENKYSRATCWLIFTKQYSKAVDLLMRSKDESHHMMSGTLAALIPQASGALTTSIELREHCEHLIVRLQDPYFRAMLIHLTLGDWDEVLQEEALPFKERLAIAFQFLEDRDLSSYLRRMVDKACTTGDIEGLILTGLTKPGMDILQSYVDRTGDIQTAAILSAYCCPAMFADSRAEHWLEAYRDLLDGFKLFHHRVAFDMERGRILQDAIVNDNLPPFEWAPPQILLKCNYCSKPINAPGVVPGDKTRTDGCPHCGRGLPRCAVCLMAMNMVRDTTRAAELAHPPFRDTIDEAIIICQTCRHGGHASHILDWFFGENNNRPHGTCPVAECDCRCADEF